MVTFIKSKKFILLVVVGALVAGGVFLYLNRNPSGSRNNPESGINQVDYSGPTQEEAEAGNNQKDANIKQDEQISNAKPATEANLQIADAAQYDNTIEVRAFITNVYEEGTCTAVFTKDNSKVTTSSNAFKDATSTQCGANDTPRASFTSTGDWQLTLTYTSKSGINGTAQKVISIR